MKLLQSKLQQLQDEKEDRERAADRASQIGTGDRSEKIRTYNFPQDRVTDHRIKESWSNVAKIMNGAIEPILEALAKAEARDSVAQAARKDFPLPPIVRVEKSFLPPRLRV